MRVHPRLPPLWFLLGIGISIIFACEVMRFMVEMLINNDGTPLPEALLWLLHLLYMLFRSNNNIRLDSWLSCGVDVLDEDYMIRYRKLQTDI